MTEPLRLTRALEDRLPPRTDERGRVRMAEPDADFYARDCRTYSVAA